MLVWLTLSRAGIIPNRVFPPPDAVIRSAWALLRSGELERHIAISTRRAVTGLAIGGLIGCLLGVVTGLIPSAARLLDSSVQMLRAIPNLALIPMVILWFGVGEEAKIFLIAFGTFFPLYLNTYHGIRSVDGNLLEMGRSYGLNGFSLLRTIVLPSALPGILVGLRFALGSMWLTLIAAEAIGAESGIGFMTTSAREFNQTDVVVVGIIIYALLGKLADTITRALERTLLPWNAAYSGA